MNKMDARALPFALLPLAAALSFPALAEEGTDTAQDPHLEQVSVTATRTTRTLEESPVSISVVTAEDIARATNDGLAEALRDVPGVQITDAATPGMKRLTLRGENSQRVAILIDGQEVTDHSGYGVPLLLDPALVERIEVIRGTASVLYGGKALGGVVNFITKKGAEESVNLTLGTSFSNATEGTQSIASLYGGNDTYEYRIAYTAADHGDRETPEGTISNTEFSSDTLYAYGAVKFGYHKLSANFTQYSMASQIADLEPGFHLDMPRRDREKIAIAYDVGHLEETFGMGLRSFHIDAYTQEVDRNFVQNMAFPGFAMDTTIAELLDTHGINGQLDLTPAEGHYVIVGLQYADESLAKQTETAMFFDAPMDFLNSSDSRIEKAEMSTTAVYAQHEWQATEQLLLTTGVRSYQIEADLLSSTRDGLEPGTHDDSHQVGSIALNYSLGDYGNLRGTLSQGYHFPNLLQLAVGGTLGPEFVNPNPDLKAETSLNHELGYRFHGESLTLDAALFYSDAENYITETFCSDVAIACLSDEQRTYTNANSATSKGLELSVQYAVTENLVPYLNASWTHREEDNGSFATDAVGLPSIQGRAGIRYDGTFSWLPSYYVDLFGRGASGADDALSDGTRIRYAGWGTTNIAAGTSFGPDQQVSVNLELSNLGDKVYATASETLLAPGRAVMLRATYDW